jgi:hypothetical protein
MNRSTGMDYATIVHANNLKVVALRRSLLGEQDGPVVDAMLGLCAATASLYDAVLYVSDAFDPRQRGDALRSKVASQQSGIDVGLRQTAAHAGVGLIDIPRGLTTQDRVRWISGHLFETGVLRRPQH